MRRSLLLFAAVMLAASPAVGQSPQSPKKPAVPKPSVAKPAKPTPKKAAALPPGPYDGDYKGVLSPAPALSKKPCAGLTVEEFKIDRNRILYIPGLLAFEGSVTTAGFVTGVVHTAGDSKAPLQGRISEDTDGVHIRAGIIDDTSGCAWTMDLKKLAAPVLDVKKP